MTFKEIKVGYPAFFLDKASVAVSQGKVTAVSMPHVQPMTNPVIPMAGAFAQTQPMVIDVTIEEGGNTKTYTIPENLDVTYAGDKVISTSRDLIIREVEVLKSRSEEVLLSVDRHKEVRDKCETILTEWNPSLKERKANEARFGALEGDMKEMKDMIKNLLTKLS